MEPAIIAVRLLGAFALLGTTVLFLAAATCIIQRELTTRREDKALLEAARTCGICADPIAEEAATYAAHLSGPVHLNCIPSIVWISGPDTVERWLATGRL